MPSKKRSTHNAELRKRLNNLGVDTQEIRSPTLSIAGAVMSTSRIMPEQISWLHLVATSHNGKPKVWHDVRAVAAAMGRAPVMAVMAKGTIEQVVMPDWVFALLIRLAGQCNPSTTQTLFSSYLHLGMQMSETDRALASSILSILESQEQSSGSTSDTD